MIGDKLTAVNRNGNKAILENNIPNELPITRKESLSVLARVEDYIREKYEIRLNVVSTKIESRSKTNGSAFQELNEHSLFRELQHENLNIALTKLTSLLQSDFVATYNPFMKYFEELTPWNRDHEPDYISKLCDYIPAADPVRFKKHFMKMLVRSVACALDDRIFNKQVFVLVHEMQNSGKSTFCRWLCPPALSNYIVENINTDKDSMIALSTNFIVNMDELATLSRTELNSLKSLISKDKINIRMPFAKKATVMPRRANFIGSTNKDEFLTDETGSVRWLCFSLNDQMNFAYKEEVNIDDIWRQAYTLYKEGFEFELTPQDILENEKANETFQMTSIEVQLIQKFFAPPNSDGDKTFYTSADICLKLSSLAPNIRTNMHNVGRAMKRLGFEKANKYSDEKRFSVKGYYVKLLDT